MRNPSEALVAPRSPGPSSGCGETGCRFCKALSRTVGRLLYFVLRKKWEHLDAGQVRPHLRGLDLELVGGLKTRGWTVHDVDVIGSRSDVLQLVKRLRKAGVRNPVHFCNGYGKHSHVQCIAGGLAALFLGDRIYGGPHGAKSA
jgi:hypothetical protein